MREFKRVAVFCAASHEVPPHYLTAARGVGRALAERGIGVVYGGGRTGLMGQVADGALAAGGEVIGVITEKLMSVEVGHEGLTQREVVQTMHERKQRMAAWADGFVALPGGLGTLEELFEAATWTQINDHVKPVGLLNLHGFFTPLIGFLEHAARLRFIRPGHDRIIQHAAALPELLELMAKVDLPQFQPPRADA